MGNQKGKKGFFWWGDLLQTLYIQDFVGSYGFCFCCCGGAIWHFYSSYFDQIYICSILEIFYSLFLCFQAYSSVLFSTKRSATIMSKCLFVHLKTKANEKIQEKKNRWCFSNASPILCKPQMYMWNSSYFFFFFWRGYFLQVNITLFSYPAYCSVQLQFKLNKFKQV